MQVTIREEPSGTLVSIVGSVDSLTASDLQAAMTGAQQNGQTRLVADFSGVAGARPNVLRVLEVSGLVSIVPRFRERVRMFDPDKIDYVIEEGERAALEQVPYLRRLLGVQPPAAAAA